MIYFSASEILISVIASAIYGVLFSLFSLAFVVFVNFFKELFKSIKKSFDYSIKLTVAHPQKTNTEITGAHVFIGIIIFTVGYILLCYYSLDASFRGYVLLISAVTYFVFYSFLNKIFTPIFAFILLRLIFCLSVVIRIFTLPFFRIYVYIKRKKAKNNI